MCAQAPAAGTVLFSSTAMQASSCCPATFEHGCHQPCFLLQQACRHACCSKAATQKRCCCVCHKVIKIFFFLFLIETEERDRAVWNERFPPSLTCALPAAAIFARAFRCSPPLSCPCLPVCLPFLEGKGGGVIESRSRCPCARRLPPE